MQPQPLVLDPSVEIRRAADEEGIEKISPIEVQGILLALRGDRLVEGGNVAPHRAAVEQDDVLTAR